VLGRLVYLYWFRPLGFARKTMRRGVARTLKAWRGRRGMERAAWRLEVVIPAGSAYPTPVAFLTGRDFWHLTVFCAASLQHHSPRPIHFEFHDDGSLDPRQAARLGTLFPSSVIHPSADLERALDEHLPKERFPTIRARRMVYPHLRKITDIHVGKTGWRALLDSDMLFHAPPTEFLDWLEAPSRPLHMIDVGDYYGYTRPLLERLAKADIPSGVNVGITGMRSDAFDWALIDQWISDMQRAEGTSYYQEQALFALMMARETPIALPADRYVVQPGPAELQSPRAILHHYVDATRLDLYIQMWERAFQ
jgi:hypothetical protein